MPADADIRHTSAFEQGGLCLLAGWGRPQAAALNLRKTSSTSVDRQISVRFNYYDFVAPGERRH